MANLTVAPQNLKSIQPYLKIAQEHEKRDPSITYWCRLYGVQAGLKMNDKSPENSAFFLGLMDWLEKYKKTSQDETVTNDVVAQAHIENYALKLFMWADNEDRSGRFNKNVVKAFYTAGFMYDIVNTFGEPSDEVLHHCKYAKWKSTYIHNCLKNGITPVAGPMAMEGEEDYDSLFSDNPGGSNNQPPSYPTENTNPQLPYPTLGFNIPRVEQGSLNLPEPGAHAPPSTPNGTSQAATSITDDYSDNGSKGEIPLKPEDFHKAQKYCKWAGSALQYEDAPTAIENLQKALRLLTTGQDA